MFEFHHLAEFLRVISRDKKMWYIWLSVIVHGDCGIDCGVTDVAL
jgi:hypothetical protein